MFGCIVWVLSGDIMSLKLNVAMYTSEFDSLYNTCFIYSSQYENKDRKDQGSVRSCLSPTPSAASSSTSRACSPLPPPLPILSTPSRLTPTQIRESPEDEETTGLLENTATSPSVGEDGGTENPLLTSLLRPHALSPLPLSPVDLDLDESHVWDCPASGYYASLTGSGKINPVISFLA